MRYGRTGLSLAPGSEKLYVLYKKTKKKKTTKNIRDLFEICEADLNMESANYQSRNLTVRLSTCLSYIILIAVADRLIKNIYILMSNRFISYKTTSTCGKLKSVLKHC